MRKTQINADWSQMLGRTRPDPQSDPSETKDDGGAVQGGAPVNAGAQIERPEVTVQDGRERARHETQIAVPFRANPPAVEQKRESGRGPNRNAYLVESLYEGLLDHLERQAESGVRTNQTRVIEAALEEFFAGGAEGDNVTLQQLIAIASRSSGRKVAVPYRLSGSVERRVEVYWRALKRRRVETRWTITRTDIVELALGRYLAHEGPSSSRNASGT